MSSIRLYVLGALADEGPMHGHQLRQLAEKEHIDQWTDISVGALYGTIKRLAAEGLIAEVRTEQVGGYPERVIYEITEQGRVALGALRIAALQTIVIKADPFDLAIARPDARATEALPGLIAARIVRLRAQVEESRAHSQRIAEYLSELEQMVMRHRDDRLVAEIAWHEELLERLPGLLAAHHDHASTKD